MTSTMLLNGIISADDAIKLLILLIAGAAVLLLARWAANLGDAPSRTLPTETIYDPFPAEDSAARRSSISLPVTDPSTPLYSFPPDPALGRLRVTKFFFKTIDPEPGPPDPELFADELFIKLYDPDSGHSWGQSYLVATPPGLAQILRERSWRYLHAHEVLVFPRYDLAEIRRAVIARILIDHDFFDGSNQDLEEEEL